MGVLDRTMNEGPSSASGDTAAPMSLSTRLVISHAVPVTIVLVALAVVLLALARISVVLSTLSSTELVALRDEGTIHRAAWDVDVQMRHGFLACGRGESSADVARRIDASRRVLTELLSTRARENTSIRRLAREYVAIATDVLSADACTKLLDGSVQTQRTRLDERMTDVWVDRLAELHAAVDVRDGDARATAEAAIGVGVPLAGLSFALAMVLAAQLARLLRRPLASLAQNARRVGRGDFGVPVSVTGPGEIVALASELESMRSQLEKLDKLKQGFLASVSHELRTPLSKIREALSLLSDGVVGDLEARQMRVVQIARVACEREIRMVTTLLDLSRLRTGSPLRLSPGVAIDGVITSAVDDERGDASARGVTVDVELDTRESRCELDPVLMERAIANLVRNAVAVSPRGRAVRVVARRVDEPSPHVRVEVRDEGPGVPAAIRATVFDAFVTHDVPSTGKSVGVGIGLALAREVARAHGGDLVLLDAPSTGATFVVTVPVSPSPTDAPESDPR